jgi:hypothetical protein
VASEAWVILPRSSFILVAQPCQVSLTRTLGCSKSVIRPAIIAGMIPPHNGLWVSNDPGAESQGGNRSPACGLRLASSWP